jgi:hypothetical protein
LNTLELETRTAWRALPWKHYGICAECGEAKKYVAGKTKRRMLCLECFGQKGK